MKKINVQLYGGKNIFKEVPLEADIIYCDSKDDCSLFKDGKCLLCRSFLGDICKKGRRETVKGYTSRAKKYSAFREKYKNDETYGKLHYPSDNFAVIDDEYWFDLKYVRVRKPTDSDFKSLINEWGYIIDNVGFSRGFLHIPKEKMNAKFLNDIFRYRPRTVFNNENNEIISDYADKVVPNIINEMKKQAPELYNELIENYPEYDVAPNYIGRYAYTKTLKNGTQIKDCHGDVGTLKDGKIYCDNFTKGFVPFNGLSATVVVEVKDTDTYKITSNDEWDENTKFK